ncbi:MAG: LLM class flavin-dependent oxidoreductase [Acidimicrobiia bacterium]|nr:LLM class flavin-dependent oxidoreductase [Acidimicrobiia bacterium]
MRPLSVGVQLPEVEREVRWAEMRSMAVLAEAIGFDSIWVGDHLLYRPEEGEPRGPWEAWSMLAAIASVTERVEIGPLVAATAFHSPAMLAKKAVTVDEISGGRLILGLGAGWNRAEFDAFGYPFDYRASRFEEAFHIIRRLIRGETVDHDGDFYRNHRAQILPYGPRPAGPPLLIGSQGPRVLRATAPFMDQWNGWYAWYGNSPEGLPALLEKLDSACDDVGRDSSGIEKTVAVLATLPGGEGRVHGDVEQVGKNPLAGSPAEIADVLGRYSELGISHVQMVLDLITEESIEWFGDVLAELDA